MKKLGLYIGRLNPVHNGHLNILEKMISENNDSLLLLGTPLLKDSSKNPLGFEERKKILRKIFSEDVLKVIKKNDNPKSNLAWVVEIYRIIKEKFGDVEEVNFYYGATEDMAFSVLKESLLEFCPFKINFIKIEREESFVENNGEKLELSATNFRKYLREGDFETAKKFTDERIFEEIKKYF